MGSSTCRRHRAGVCLLPQMLGHRLRPRTDVQLFIDSADVGMHGVIADAECFGDFLVKETLREVIEHFLSRGEKDWPSPLPQPRVPAPGTKPPPCAQCDCSSASHPAQLLDGRQQLVRRRLFEQITARSADNALKIWSVFSYTVSIIT